MPQKHTSLDQLAGEGPEIEFEGKDITMSPLGPRDLAKAKAHLRGERWAAYRESIELMAEEHQPSPKEQRRERNEIMRMFISDQEVGQWWLNTMDGLLDLLHRSFNKGRSNEDEDKPDRISKDELEELFQDQERIISLAKTILNEVSGFELEEEGEGDEEDSGEAEGGESTAP